ncbi:Rne/Rng family ribonuclease [Geodermatophilus sp. DSM 44513]|uniref:Rne/Rng family ribonuclease n=1 Tax=Geodermatophilus sp. DSM 44513 TaxID=1528104 RepID=UPI0012757361|nr:Rne/Rng family ribonuclease [Geodermatophilus sp. DSM 44513]WNV76944.1 Rne/Rng family ribonuclease [Geodermatophilus sp. DSM 44513]
MADQTDDRTTTPAEEDLAAPPQDGDTPAAEQELLAAESGEDDDAGERAAAEAPAEHAPAEDEAPEPPVAEPEEAPVSRFGAQFSSPEPTAVIARPRRRATRPAGAADPDAYTDLPPVAPALPAFVSFVAPTETDAPAPPRRRSRRPLAESPVAEEADAEPAEDLDEDVPAPRSRRGRSRRRSAAEETPAPVEDTEDTDTDEDAADEDTTAGDDGDDTGGGSRRRRRGRRGRGRGRTGEDAGDGDEDTDEDAGDERGTDDADEDSDAGEDTAEDDDEGGSSTRRRRRRRRRGSSSAEPGEATADGDDDRPERAGRNGRTTSDDDVRGVAGSTRLEAKRQRRRDGRDSGRRRTAILTESEFLARREAVDRKMVIRQRGERTQIAVLEDDVLVEHYVTQAQATSFAGNVYLGRVQNVLPSMEAAFVDIGKGRNAVVYAGEVNWDAAGLSGKQRSIEQAMKSGDKVLVQVTKDPIGHKGARLTQQVNLPGRFLVYVPGGSMTGISRKLPDTERTRLKDILKKIVPEDAGVIIRTAAEGASEEELTRDVARLQAQWEVIQKKAESSSTAPALLYGEPDLAIRVIRDVFNEDFKELVVQGDDAWDTVEAYVAHVSPELSGRLTRHTGEGDVFRDLRIDEQLMKALDRKVWLPSGGSLVIDRTEAMTVVDVNTGKFTGSGGNLEQTVTRNNMEAAEEIVRQLRLRDIGGMIVIDFIDMVLESNRDLVLRRLTECLGRDRTKHQVAEVTSLGLVQMTRKRVGQGLLEVFSEPCEHCRGRGVVVHLDPAEDKRRGGGNAPAGNGGGTGRREQQRGDRGRDGGARPAEETPDPVPADAAEETPAVTGTEGDGQRSGGGRRSRGRRNRGQSGEDRAAEDAAVLTATVDAPAPEVEQPAVEQPEVEQPEVEQPVVEQPEAAVPEAAAAGGTPEVADPAPVEPVAERIGTPFAAQPQAAEQESAQPQAAQPQAVDQEAAQPEPPADDEAVPAGAGPDDPGPAEAHEDPVEPTPVEAPVTRPRRRRAASRPAGPPAS